MSVFEIDESHTYQPGSFSVPERGEIRIEGCPPSIDKQLIRASFEQKAANIFVKTQQALDDRDTEFQVVRVRLDGPVMYVTARDSVGIVSLTPRTNLRIEPKIDWESIFDMLLSVQGRKRSVEYHGIPIEEVRTDDIDLEDVFLILAINFLNGMEDLHKNGFVRRIETHRADLEQPRGVIDVERSLVNQAEGRASQHCLLKKVNYDNPANSLLHYAGTHLLRLFEQYKDRHDHQAYYHIFSQIHEEVRHLERLGVTSGRRRMPEYRAFSLNDLPKQRHYYEQAIDVSKAVVSSSLGTPASEGEQKLVVDYVLNMESLFEQYSQVVIERAFKEIESYDHLDSLTDVTPVRSPSVKPFEGEREIYHQPDHAIEEGEKTIAVLDSKYYAEGHDPVKESTTRSRLFSYAYLLDTERLGFLCPLLEPRRRNVIQTGSELQVISPVGEFTLDSYDGVVEEYLHEALVAECPELEVFRAVYENQLSLDGAHHSDLSAATSMSGPFTFKDPKEFSLKVVKAAADEHSWNVRNRYDLEQNGEWSRDQIQTRCDNYYEHTHTCIPVFCRDDGDEWIDLYFIESSTGEVEKEGPLKLL